MPLSRSIVCLRLEWRWRNFTRHRGTGPFQDLRWCGLGRGGIDLRCPPTWIRWEWYPHLFQSKSEAGSGHTRFLVCQKKGFPPSALSALSQASFCGGSSTSGSRHLFFNGAGLKLGSLHLFFSCASLKPGSFYTFSSTVQAPRWVLWLPELWACKSIEEWLP